MSVHVAILLKPYLDMTLDGRKTVESRLTKPPLAPFRQVEIGERVFFKQSAGPFRATAVVSRVEFHEGLTPERVAEFRARLNAAIGGDAGYWDQKADARYATFVWLTRVEALDVGPAMKPSRGPAWFVLPDDRSPLLDVTLTAAALRHGTIRVPARYRRLRGQSFRLDLPGGERVTTEVNSHQCLRWRGLRRYATAFDLRPGDVARMIARGPRRYELRFVLNPR